jgi:bla regulator protein blaR1
MEYLIKASAVIAIFYVCYKLFLQRETFFESNRWFLLIGIIVAFAIPLVVIPIYVTVESLPLENIIISSDNSPIGIVEKPFDILQLISIIYLFGVVLFLGKILLQFGSLKFLLLSNNKHKRGSYTFIKTNSNTHPFSFFKWIVYNPKQFNKDELQQIITHEKVHARQYHSIDIILTQISSIVFWFNPFVWLYKKAMEQNLEFIADKSTQEQINCKKSYQHLLLKTSVPHYKMALANNFYNSLIKKRIVMLHKSKSNKFRVWKYALILPVLALFLMNFNTKEVITYTESSNSNNLVSESLVDADEIEERLISKDFSKADLEQVKKELADKGVKLKFSGIKRNSENEIIAIKIEAESDSASANFNTSSDEPIDPIVIKINTENNKISIGNTSNSDMHFGEGYTFVTKDGNHKIHKSGKGNNVFVYSSDNDKHEDEHEVIEKEDKIIIKSGAKIHEIKKVLKDKNVFVISGDKGEIIDLKGEAIKYGKAIIEKDKKGNFVKGYKHKDGNVKIWTGDDDKVYEFRSNDDKGNDKFFISNKDGNQPLIILDGKEIVNKKKLDDLVEPNNIESISVLKGEAAIKLYGKKGKDGVVEIYSKGKNNNPKINNSVSDIKFIMGNAEILEKKFFESNDVGENALFILDDKEVSKNEISNLDRNKIETVFVLKGDAATKKYGKKGKDGVIIITTKNKE